MRKQLTMIKVAGVAVSLAAAGIAGMASANTPVIDQSTGTCIENCDAAQGLLDEHTEEVGQGQDPADVDGTSTTYTPDQVEALNEEVTDNAESIDALTDLVQSQADVQVTYTADPTLDDVESEEFTDKAAAETWVGDIGGGTVETTVTADGVELATKSDLDNLEGITDTTLTEDQVDDFVSDNGYATTDQVNAQVDAAIEVGKSYVDDATDGLATTDQVNAQVDAAIAVGEAYVDAEIDAAIEVGKTYVDEAIAGIETGDVDLSEIEDAISSNDVDISLNSSAIYNNGQDIDQLESDVALQDQGLKNIASNVNTLEEDIYDIEDDIEDLQDSTVKFDNNGDVDFNGADLNDVDDIWAEGDLTIEGDATIEGDLLVEFGDDSAIETYEDDLYVYADDTLDLSSGEEVYIGTDGFVTIAADESVEILADEIELNGTVTINGEVITSGADGAAGADGKDGTNGTNGTNGADGADGQDGAKGDKGDKGDTGAKGATGATGATGAAGRDGQDARINVNSEGQYVVSDSSGTAVTVATDEQVTIAVDDLEALVASTAAKLAADIVSGIQAEADARVEAIAEEAEARIEALADAAAERIQIKNIAVANTVAIVSLEEQWKTDPVIGATKITDNQGNVVVHTAPDGSTEAKVARVHNPTTIAERVTDNTSRIQSLESVVFAEDTKEDAVDRFIGELWAKAKKAKQKNEPLYVMTSEGMVDLRGWHGSTSRHGHGIMIALDKTLAYDVMGLNTVWVTLK